jgi:hypothetical protein
LAFVYSMEFEWIVNVLFCDSGTTVNMSTYLDESFDVIPPQELAAVPSTDKTLVLSEGATKFQSYLVPQRSSPPRSILDSPITLPAPCTH